MFLDEECTGLTTTSEHTGTERYLAPELVMSDTTVYPTIETDVYALGCLGLEVSCPHDQSPADASLTPHSSYFFKNRTRIVKTT